MNPNFPDNDRDEASPSGPAELRASPFADLLGARPAPRAVTVTDVVGVVVGFSVAGYAFRGTILAVHDAGATMLSIVAGVLFAWLGLVVSGPVVMGLRRVQHGRRSKLSAGEMMWIVLGLLWLGVGVARRLRSLDPILPIRVASFTAAAAASVSPLLLVLHWRFERKHASPSASLGWCHYAGVFCAAAWPAGWTLAAFLLGV